ncbi:MAG: HDOD domain-containing protein [Desulfuromonadaceae bacterium]|nr:HDOD domain-containing protein [Desulfuromonadaceae bacterium]
MKLGSQQVVNLAFTASMANNKSNNPIINAHLKRLWQHSHTVAITSSWLTLQYGHDNNIDVNTDEAYLAGLLHIIGKLYLLKSMDSLIESGKLQIERSFID